MTSGEIVLTVIVAGLIVVLIQLSHWTKSLRTAQRKAQADAEARTQSELGGDV